MRWKRWIIPILFLVVVLGAGLVYVLNTPRLVSGYPGVDAHGVPASESLRMEFSKPIDIDSLQTHLTISPSIEGSFTAEDRQIIFTPQDGWPRGKTIRIEISAGWVSESGLPLLAGESWTFTISNYLIAYLWPSDGPADIYALDPETGEILRFTQEPSGVLDFSVSVDGLSIYYTAMVDGIDSRIYRIDRGQGTTSVVLECQGSLCRSPIPSPDGSILAYERHSSSEIGVQVWLIMSGDGEPYLAGQAPHQTSSPMWSSQGLLVFYDHDENAYIFTENGSDQTIIVHNETGEHGTWHPSGQLFIAPEVSLVSVVDDDDESQIRNIASSHLIEYGLYTEISNNLSQEILLEDVAPQFSPSGLQIVFARKQLDVEHWSPGRQIWIMASDGGNAHPLTDSPEYQHTEMSFSPDGSQIAYLRFNQTTLTDPPEIWLVDVDGSDAMRLVIGGYSPQWIP